MLIAKTKAVLKDNDANHDNNDDFKVNIDYDDDNKCRTSSIITKHDIDIEDDQKDDHNNNNNNANNNNNNDNNSNCSQVDARPNAEMRTTRATNPRGKHLFQNMRRTYSDTGTLCQK